MKPSSFFTQSLTDRDLAMIKMEGHRTCSMQPHLFFRVTYGKSWRVFLNNKGANPFRTFIFTSTSKRDERICFSSIRYENFAAVQYVDIPLLVRFQFKFCCI